MDDSISGLLFFISLFFSTFFSSTETAFFSLSPLRLKKMKSEGDLRAAEILNVLEDKQRVLITLFICNIFSNVLATSIATASIVSWRPSSNISEWIGNTVYTQVAIAAFLMATIIIILGEIIPKTVAIFGAYGYSRAIVKPLRFFVFLLYPFSSFIVWIFKKFFPRFADWNSHLGSPNSMNKIDHYFILGEEAGIIERDEKEMISSVFEFGDTSVREVMVPRPDIEALPISATLDEIFIFIRADGHSRFPVFDGSIDKIIGFLYVKDILIKLEEIKANFDLFKLLRAPFFVPETKKLDDMLSEFQKRKLHMAVVVDEYGGVAGIVTIEDLLEEIVGEIVDEYDLEEQAPMSKIDENVYSIDAKYSIGDLETELNCSLDYEDADTVGGFVLEKLGQIPVRGESFEEPQGIFQVTEIKGNRILRVKFTLSP